MALPEELLEGLYEHLTSDIDNEFRQSDSDDEEGFRIRDLDSAAWAVRKIEKAQRRIDQVEKVAASQIVKIQAWVAEMTQSEHHTIEAMESLLKPYIEQELQGSKKRSLKVLGATIGFRKAQPQYIKDDTALLDWAKANDYTRIKVDPDWARIKKDGQISNGRLVSPDGEIIPGVIVETPPDQFYVKLEEDGK